MKQIKKWLYGLYWLGIITTGCLVLVNLLFLFQWIEFFPFRLLTIGSTSMAPFLEPNDIVLVEEVPIEAIQMGDIISFYVDVDRDGKKDIVTHVVGDIILSDNETFLFTHGWTLSTLDEWVVTQKSLIGRMILKIPGIGVLKDFFLHPLGWIWLIIHGCLYIIELLLHKKSPL